MREGSTGRGRENEREKKKAKVLLRLTSFFSLAAPLPPPSFFSLHSNNDESRLSRLGAGTSNTARNARPRQENEGCPLLSIATPFSPRSVFSFQPRSTATPSSFLFFPAPPPPSSRVSCTPLSDNLAILQAVAPTPASKRASKASPATPAAIPAAAPTPTRRSALASTLSLAVAVGAAAMLPAGPAAAKGAS